MQTKSQTEPRAACRLSIRGVVQGVGFRPFVYRAADRWQIAGWVLNDAAGVEVHAEGPADRLDAFLAELRAEPPAAAKITQFTVRATDVEGFVDFQIRASRHAGPPIARVSPDLAVCDDCLRELADPSDRHYRYPYVNCTNCGPRYSILRRLPYDRVNTAMAAWACCARCRREYEDPLDRRYHAQPIACPDCGPGYRLLRDGATIDTTAEAIRGAAEILRAGGILAVKGIGGYHLACDARNAAAVETLRTRKFRKEKPFALMVRTIEEARARVKLTPLHEKLLLDVARPIVLAPAKVALPSVAPDQDSLGIMLPYAPLHHLLFEQHAPSPLVLTSANRSSEPIAFRDDDAQERLAPIADAFLVGERPIVRRVDDSVVTVRRDRPFMIRRARGYAPAAVCQLAAPWRPGLVQPVLALGADLKNSIALVVDGTVLVSQHIGDLDDYESELAFAETVRDLLAMYEIPPETLTIAHDLHPQYKSTRFAATFPAQRCVAVQHHHAHLASVLAERDLLEEQVGGVIFDGTGYGCDGSIWGGEFFVGSVRTGFLRYASLRPVHMPGGDAAARFPVQAAAAFLAEQPDLPAMDGAPFHFPRRFDEALSLVARDVRCFVSTSVGRLFDAVAALCGFTRPASFEGQAAIWLEHQARAAGPQAAYAFPDLDHRPLFAAILADRLADRPAAEIAAAFHASLVATVVERIRRMCREHDLQTVALSGGVFQNELLLEGLFERAAQLPGIRLITNERVPVNDGGICLGQAALAIAGPVTSNVHNPPGASLL